jgi:hypothetical protein
MYRSLERWAFTCTLGYSRRTMAEVALDQKIGTLLRMKLGHLVPKTV